MYRSCSNRKAVLTQTQVLIEFLGAAYLSIILAILHYFVAFDPHENPFQIGESSADTHRWNANPIDVLVKKILRYGNRLSSFLGRIRLSKWLKDKPVWRNVFEKVV